MIINDLVNKGFLREIITERVPTLVLNRPVEIVVSAPVLAELKRRYPKDRETGGIFFAVPDAQTKRLVINRVVFLENQLSAERAKTGYSPNGTAYRAAITDALTAGAFPVRFHSHPVETGFDGYDINPVSFFQKTSVTDKHTSYLPYSVQGKTVVMPDALVVPTDKQATEIRVIFYNGFVAPLSVNALLEPEKLYIYTALIGLFLVGIFSRLSRSALFFLCAGLGVVFLVYERTRPRYSSNADKSLSVRIY